MANTAGIVDVFGELFRTPLEAVVKAEREYFKIWAEWLEVQIKLLGENPTGDQIKALLEKAPSVQIDGFIDVGITMRIASVSEQKQGGTAGLKLGPIHASGSFGFAKSGSQESVFQTSARFTLSNHNSELSRYLEDRRLTPTSIEGLKEVKKILIEESSTPVQGQ